ncbi:serine/threonine-protein kinase [Allocatelliglobosispora scoriae]|uniref:non-specific serine/threonine protein kinase n=1 Tax=Allocatelliglobosispora scoriae TaxID=643052 RepID=A0A841BKI6_9ACTN|nr:serine/threonine-protein kinase [Allocatelliglobosispora scoriae]MBB5867746.1 serine/threonine-protein kinase [Allocatelliglobosispora scoriae]
MHSPGALLGGRYRLDDRVGAGGMGEVWRATDTVLGRTVAVKVVLPSLLHDPGFVRRFLVEARAMASVRHHGVVMIHDYHGDADGAYLVMEYVEGESLSQTLVRHGGRFTTQSALALIVQAAEALQAVHDKGIVHRDVKPGNLLVRLDGTVVLTDFGIARTQDNTSLTTPGGILGTPSYLAPEQVLGQLASPLSDVYALGIVAYECLAGFRPFSGDNPFAVAMQRVQQPPPPLGPDVPPAVAALVERALAVDPELRWQSAAALAEAARSVLAGAPPVAGAPAGPPAPASAEPDPGPGGVRPRKRLPVPVVAALAAIVLIGGGLAGWALWGSDASTRWEGPGSATTTELGIPAGYVACGDAACPRTPECWGGLTRISGVAHKPRRIDCDQPHSWETFAVGRLPADAEFVRQDELIGRPDIAALCSENVLAARSRDGVQTTGWQREPWPIQVDRTTWVLHCLSSRPEGGETTGAAFRGAS